MQHVCYLNMCRICAAHIATAHKQHANMWTPSLALIHFCKGSYYYCIIQDMINCTGQQYDMINYTGQQND